MKKTLALLILSLMVLTACGGTVEEAASEVSESVQSAVEEVTATEPESVEEVVVVEGSGEETSGSPMMFDTARYYRLQTKFLEEQNKCLEGNQYPDGGVLGGAAFMDDCQEVTGQLWKLVDAGDGYYRLQTMFLEEQNKCLEGNQYPDGGVLGGAAFMDDCQEVVGQLWKFVDAGDGYYRLQTKFLEEQNKCLEGNQYPDGGVLGGAAFMDDCQEVVGQLWKFVDAGDVSATPAEDVASGSPAMFDTNGYYRLQTQFLEEQNKCLEGNQYPDGGVLGGAAFMDDCQEVIGQLWKFVDAGDGYYRMQTMFLEEQNKCLEGNQYPDGGVLGGAAFMDDCQNVTGQLWTIIPAEG